MVNCSMNYPTFLNEVDRLTSDSSADTLRLFIHEMARTIPESERLRFLASLNGCSTPADNPEDGKDEKTLLADQVDSLLSALDEIQAGALNLESEYNEEWDDWQDSILDAFRFSDPDNLLGDIEAAVEALHRCLDHKEYEKGAALAKKLSELSVHISGDCDVDEMGIEDLNAYDLVCFDLEKAVAEAMYLTYMGNSDPDRAEAMLTVLDNFNYYCTSLEQILQTGADEIDLNLLLPSWIDALAKRSGNRVDQLLTEAQNMLRDKNAALDIASRCAESHPVLYQNIMRSGLDQAGADEMMSIGLRGLQEIPASHPTRATIALLTAKNAIDAGRRDTAENCWIEAFRSSPTVINYLRIRLESLEWRKYADIVRNIYPSYYSFRNSWDQKPLAALLFFDERFDDMISKFMNEKSGLGWSSTFMKEGIALMLLLLDSGTVNRPGISAMTEIAIHACSFDGDAYCEGTDLNPESSTAVLFQKCLRKWKGEILLPENTCELWLKRIEQWISLRVSAIMDANKRNYYGECAAFIAAYGEVRESLGNSGEKSGIMQQYKMDFSRRSAFHRELEKFWF